MSKENVAMRSGESELESLRKEVASMRKSFVDMALLVLPSNMRNYCDCGLLACRTVTAVKPGLDQAERFKRCTDCAIPDGWHTVGVVELAPGERETVAIANRLGCLRKPSSA